MKKTPCKEQIPDGVKHFGNYENDRNAKYKDLYSDILKEFYGLNDDTIIAHHLCISQQIGDMFIVQEIPSADTLIFDHEIAKKIWGVMWESCLKVLAVEPVDTRDDLLSTMYYGRKCK